jgi:hypothetical protein
VDPEDEAPRSAAPGWPPPHPSPPLPPPREYGAPGTPPDWRPWLWGLLAALVVGALVTVGLVVLLPDGDDDGGHAGRQPATSTSASPSSSSPPAAPAPAPYRCWDSSDAQSLKDCSRPTGEQGLHWVFPQLADQRCGKPTKTGPGVALRVLCSARLSDGSRVQLGYYQWDSVRAGVTFYGAQDLTRSDGNGFLGWTGDADGTLTSALLYAAAPYSQTVSFPARAKATQEDLQRMQPRPAKQVRGEPVG